MPEAEPRRRFSSAPVASAEASTRSRGGSRRRFGRRSRNRWRDGQLRDHRWPPLDRQLPDARADIGLRMQRRHHQLDLALGLVTRRFQKRCVVIVGQMRREQADRRQRECSFVDGLQQTREAPGGACRSDATVRSRFRQVEMFRRVLKQRAVSLSEVQPPRVHLGEQGEQCRGCLPLSRGSAFNFQQKVTIGKTLKD